MIDYDDAFDALEDVPFPDGPLDRQQAWVAVWDHLDAIALIMTDWSSGACPWWTRNQLTAGCTCRDAPRWYPGRPGDPACPVHGHGCLRPSDPVGFETLPACTCRYALRQARAYFGAYTHLIDVPGVGQRGAAWFFIVDPDCLHHGEPPCASNEPRYVEMLDEHERRGY